MAKQKSTTTEIQVTSKQGGKQRTLVMSGDLPDLHDDPRKVHQLLDLLGLPKGTEVRVVTKATSVVVR
jgi:hypothetical protein